MDEPTEMTPPPEGAPQRPPRRRVLQGGVAAGSIALLASSHRALAGGKCKLKKWSGYQSSVKKGKKKGGKKTTGSSASTAAFCPGRSPGYWANHTGSPPWPWSYKTSTKFSTVFGAAPGYGLSSSATLLTVVQTTPNTPARQFVAALLDAATGSLNPSFPYSPTDIIYIWNHTNSTQKTAYNSYFSNYLLTA
jgi:hypothetical protein